MGTNMNGHRPKRRPFPEKFGGGYSLELYCDRIVDDDVHDRSMPEQFTGQTFGQCARTARAYGWIIRRDHTATCPDCVRELRLRGPTHAAPAHPDGGTG